MIVTVDIARTPSGKFVLAWGDKAGKLVRTEALPRKFRERVYATHAVYRQAWFSTQIEATAAQMQAQWEFKLSSQRSSLATNKE